MSNKAMDKDYLLRQLRSFEGDVLAQKSIASEEGYHNFRYYNGALSYKDGNTWEDIDLGNTDYVELTQQEYDQLSTAEKMNGTLYFITDGQGQSVDNSIIADEFDATESYSSGDYCIHDGKLYKFKASHTGTWSSSDVDETTVSDEFGAGGNSGVQIPAIVGTKFHYNGTAQAPVITGFDSTHCTVTGTTSATNIGQYTITVTPSQGMTWTDGTSAAKTYTYEIIPIGVKYTPTDDIQTWLACAEIWDKTSYTTLADVLADSDTLEILLNNSNSLDYLVRSTTWTPTIVSNETVMTMIGNNDECADKLLEDYTWRTAICGSTYFESVLNVKVPTMTSNTNPSGVASGYSPSYYGDYYYCFDGSNETQWFAQAGQTERYIQYQFASPVKVNKAVITLTPRGYATSKILASNNGSDWTELLDIGAVSAYTTKVCIIPNNNKYSYYRLSGTAAEGEDHGYYFGVGELQFYGRVSSTQHVDMPYQASSLSYLRDVVITNPKNGQIPQYNASTGKWENKDFIVNLVPWSTGTDKQIAYMINAYYSGLLTLEEIKSVWSVGDVRNVDISAIASSGGTGAEAWSVGESHVAQTIQLEIIDFDHDTLSTGIGNITKALITVDTKNCLKNPSASDTDGANSTENGYINSTKINTTGWKNSARRSWCNYAFVEALPSWLKGLIKYVDKSTSAGNTSSTIETTSDKVFLSSEIEMFGSLQDSYAGEGTSYSYYSSADKRYKLPKWSSSHNSNAYFCRSPRKSNNFAYCSVGGSGQMSVTDADAPRGIVPAFCL